MIEHREDIYSRPKRTWFVTEKEKKLSAKAAKVQILFYFVDTPLNVGIDSPTLQWITIEF
jgi:hypothetical protein